MTTLVMLAILLVGILSYRLLPISNLPDVNFPTISVTTRLPGASPETMANTVATPLEKQFMTIPGVLDVTSTNTLGNSNITIQFDVSKDIDLAAIDVQSAITQAKPKLPPNLPQDPVFKKANPSDTPIIYIALTSSTVAQGELYNLANTIIGQRISTVEGVAQVTVYGSPSAVRVQVDPKIISMLGLTLQDVSKALQAANQNQPTGQLDGLELSSIIQTNGQLTRASEYENVIVSFNDEGPVRVRDIGRAQDSRQNDRESEYFVDGETKEAAVVLAVLRQPGANTVRVADAIASYLPKLEKLIPGNVTMRVVFDRSESIKHSINDVEITLILAFIMVVLVIFLYLGKLKNTIIPSIAMPMSILGTFPIMYLMGYSLDNLSLLALTLAMGFIVDDAIVVLENIERMVEEGMSPLEGALEGSRQICFTIISMTLSLVAVFIPMLFMAGIIGKLFQEFSVTLTVVTLMSGVISLSLTPMLCSLFMPPRKEQHEGTLGRFSARLNERLVGWYKPLLLWALDNRWLSVATASASIVLTVLFFKILPLDFIPDDDIGFVVAYMEGMQGTSSDRMHGYQRELIDVLREQPEIESFISIASNRDYRQGLNFIRLVPQEERESSTRVIQKLMPKVAEIPGLRVYFKNVPLIDLSIGTQTKGGYQYILSGLNIEELYSQAEQLLSKMSAHPDVFQSISSDLENRTPQLFVNVLRDQAARYGVSVEGIENALSRSFSANRISLIDTPTDQFDLIVEVFRKDQYDSSTLAYTYLRNTIANPSANPASIANANQLVPMGSVATWEEGAGFNSVNHYMQFPSVTISFNVVPGVALGDALALLNELADETVKGEIDGMVKGIGQTFEEAVDSAGLLLVFSLIAIYIILGILYESFIHPFTILSTLPPAIFGGLATLWLLGMPLSLYGFLGIILLIGIVKKNGIMVVDYALEYLKKGEDARTAIVDACVVRFRPIMMTTLAAICGAIPIAYAFGPGLVSRRPLGLVIIGGLIFSQLVTLFVTPVVFLYLEELREKYGAKPRQEE
ncbi:AcrB/AcrD/AcrF family protein [Estrella lausannensis]|uniref:AcrB/AcrD/AcrF family protein n=2 Tax=Estrella lausannensis TaxID=483423 RepID=A0A0H5E5I2_9BACT|nr:AcrB/AcrD/AcrF family protein [Estrella lausannensis]